MLYEELVVTDSGERFTIERDASLSDGDAFEQDSEPEGEAMIDHVILVVRDYARSKEFYLAAFAPLGCELLMEFEGSSGGIGSEGKPFFWIREGEPSAPIHVAFTARNTDEVDAFHAAAIAAGGKDNGRPGLRPHYHPGYYAAFVHDPDGNNAEAVFHGAQG
jgi:catechol 2,3-dioxygenase-like lactoylglutathione lyase family enzyme